LANKKERDKREQGYADIIKRIFEKSKKTYGIDRICGCLRRMGYTASYKLLWATCLRRMVSYRDFPELVNQEITVFITLAVSKSA
jgi:hypothetical protein